MTAWHWAAELIQLPRSQWDRIAQSFADIASDLESSKAVTASLEIKVGGEDGPIIRISSDQPSHHFWFEVGDTYIVYQYKPPGEIRLADPVRDHIRKIARHFLHGLAEEAVITGRLTTAGLIYELTSSLKERGTTNKQLAIDRLAGGLRQRPWEGTLAESAQPLQRLDLQWASRVNIFKELASLWLKVECPSDDEHSTVETTCVLKSGDTVLPSSKWGGEVEKIHEVAWRAGGHFLDWLLLNRDSR